MSLGIGAGSVSGMHVYQVSGSLNEEETDQPGLREDCSHERGSFLASFALYVLLIITGCYQRASLSSLGRATILVYYLHVKIITLIKATRSVF